MARHKPAAQLAYKAKEATNFNDAQVVNFLYETKRLHDKAFEPSTVQSNSALDELDARVYHMHARVLADLIIEDDELFSMVEQHFKNRIIQREQEELSNAEVDSESVSQPVIAIDKIL